MEISISQQNLDHIKRKVASGVYQSPDAVMAKALGLLDEHDKSLAKELGALAARVQDGIDALGNGDSAEYTDDTLHELFDGVKQRGRELRATRDESRHA